MIYIGIDPGNRLSAYCAIDENNKPIAFGKVDNSIFTLELIKLANKIGHKQFKFGIEKIANMGMAVGASVFETAEWIGRFIDQLYYNFNSCDVFYVKRIDVKVHICGTTRAKDVNIRQSLIDMYEPIGDGKIPQIGSRNNRGPLYGIKADIWSALAIARTVKETTGYPKAEIIRNAYI